MARTRVNAAYIHGLSAILSERDWAIIETVDLLGMATSTQIERIHFAELGDNSRVKVRQRVLKRLVYLRALFTLPRRIGGYRRGSTQPVYALDTAGQWLIRQRDTAADIRRLRRRELPTERFMRHALDVCELYASLVQASRTAGGAQVTEFATEPECWWPAGTRKPALKPDAYLALSLPGSRWIHHWWVEVDRATEHMPTIRRKLTKYLDVARRGQLGPHGALPRVLVTTPTQDRCAAITATLRHLDGPADDLITVTPFDAAVELLTAHAHSAEISTPTPEKGQLP